MNDVTADGSDVLIRTAGDADSDAIAELRALWTTNGAPEPGFAARMAAWLAAEGERRTTWLAQAGGRSVGMVSLLEYRRMPMPARADSRWGYVGNLFVREDSRNRGIGSALLAAVIAAAEERSYERLVVSPSSEALSLFRRAGFVLPERASDTDALLVRPGRRS
jgi:GNAT superfamily N-acetyltransferase